MKQLRKAINIERMSAGDTIVEVLIAIAIAAFAIGISYATAQRSLQQSITAREHNEALNEAENQVADLSLRFQHDPANFDTLFSPQNHFCLNDQSSGPNDTVHRWQVYNNWNDPALLDLSSPLATSTSPDRQSPYYYDSVSQQGCTYHKGGDGVTYFIDIAKSASGSTGPNSNVYSITVRWERIGGGQHNQVGLSYKLNGSNARTLADTIGNPSPPSPPQPPPNCTNVPSLITESDQVRLYYLSTQDVDAQGRHHRLMLVDLTQSPRTPWIPNPACVYTMTVLSQLSSPVPNPAQPHEQMFIEFCANITSDCDASLATASNYTNFSPNPLYRTPNLTNDIPEPSTSVTTTYSIQLPQTPINYILLKHCSIEPSTWTSPSPSQCRANLNSIQGYDITFSGAPA